MTIYETLSGHTKRIFFQTARQVPHLLATAQATYRDERPRHWGRLANRTTESLPADPLAEICTKTTGSCRNPEVSGRGLGCPQIQKYSRGGREGRQTFALKRLLMQSPVSRDDPSTAGGKPVLQHGLLFRWDIAEEHMGGVVGDHQIGLAFHRHGLRSHAACPEQRHFTWLNRDGPGAPGGRGDVIDADRSRFAHVQRATMVCGEP